MHAREHLIREWVSRARQGDEEAFARLVDTFAPGLYALAVRYLGDPQEAEDVVQETFFRAYLHLWRVDPGRPFRSWITTIAIRLCIDRVRRRRNRVSVEHLPYEGRWLQGREPPPEDVALREEARERMYRLVLCLPDLERAVVVLHYWEGYSLQEIAAILGRSVSAVKSLLFRARKRLRQWWEQETPPNRHGSTP